MVNKFKRLAIISDCVHMRDNAGNVVTENHIYCRQMQALSALFEHTVIVCPFVKWSAESVTSVYTQTNLNFIELPYAGGNTVKDKWQLICTIPAWIKAFRKASRVSDIIYLRMPNNLNIPGFFYFKFISVQSFATYTGTWENYLHEPVTYRFQKWLLKYFFKGPVWIYTEGQKSSPHLLKGFSPSYSNAEWEEETLQVDQRIAAYKNMIISTPIFITVGALVPNKNQQYILETCRLLRDSGYSFNWYIVGDGYMKTHYEAFIKEHALTNCVCVAGKKNYQELRQLYRKANFLVQATLVEGFGKVPVEAMFHGVIPILSKTAMANEMTANGKRGYTFDVSDKYNLADLIKNVLDDQATFGEIIYNGRGYVKMQTLDNWVNEIVKHIQVL